MILSTKKKQFFWKFLLGESSLNLYGKFCSTWATEIPLIENTWITAERVIMFSCRCINSNCCRLSSVFSANNYLGIFVFSRGIYRKKTWNTKKIITYFLFSLTLKLTYQVVYLKCKMLFFLKNKQGRIKRKYTFISEKKKLRFPLKLNIFSKAQIFHIKSPIYVRICFKCWAKNVFLNVICLITVFQFSDYYYEIWNNFRERISF